MPLQILVQIIYIGLHTTRVTTCLFHTLP